MHAQTSPLLDSPSLYKEEVPWADISAPPSAPFHLHCISCRQSTQPPRHRPLIPLFALLVAGLGLRLIHRSDNQPGSLFVRRHGPSAIRCLKVGLYSTGAHRIC
uniref:Uncharacterized protein n=1 Tax=Plectus sambesii TaxID=2011161 RepID=A0A914UJA8_9BILA